MDLFTNTMQEKFPNPRPTPFVAGDSRDQSVGHGSSLYSL